MRVGQPGKLQVQFSSLLDPRKASRKMQLMDKKMRIRFKKKFEEEQLRNQQEDFESKKGKGDSKGKGPAKSGGGFKKKKGGGSKLNVSRAKKLGMAGEAIGIGTDSTRYGCKCGKIFLD